jgi:hypothetical protein
MKIFVTKTFDGPNKGEVTIKTDAKTAEALLRLLQQTERAVDLRAVVLSPNDTGFLVRLEDALTPVL